MFTIKKANASDYELLNKLGTQIFPDTYKDIISPSQMSYMLEWMYSPENIKKQIEEEGHVYFIAYNEYEAAGYVSVQPEGKDIFHLQKLYVLPRYQGCGLGKILFKKAMSYIHEIHSSSCQMELNVNRHNPALGFYERMGMKKIREEDFPIGNGFYMNDYIMGIKIS